jgi:hypothetical protein
MEGTFNTNHENPVTGEQQQNNDAAVDLFRFLDLPAELRAMVYEKLLPQADIFMNPHRLQRPGDYIVYVRGNIENSKQDVTDTIALTRACRTTHMELGSRFYNRQHFVISNFEAANRFQSNLHPSNRPRIQDLAVNFLTRYPRSETYLKANIRDVVEGLGELRTLTLRGVDNWAHAPSTGTKWKPRDLRAIAVILKHSNHLRKAFYPILRPPNTGIAVPMTTVRLTTSDGAAGPQVSSSSRRGTITDQIQEMELDVDAEYTKWLLKNRERREQRAAAKANTG